MEILLICYAAGATYLLLELVFFRDVKDSFPKLFLIALIWPLSIAFLGDLLQYRETDKRKTAGETFAAWQRKPPSGDYNADNLGGDPDGGAEDMAAFITSLETRPDAPLPDALTFSYKLTGVTKTYPKGTLFPSALVRDWKRGFYMGEKMAAEDEG